MTNRKALFLTTTISGVRSSSRGVRGEGTFTFLSDVGALDLRFNAAVDDDDDDDDD